jgi:hypothetical protein
MLVMTLRRLGMLAGTTPSGTNSLRTALITSIISTPLGHRWTQLPQVAHNHKSSDSKGTTPNFA